MPKLPTPTAVPRDMICDQCGLAWNLHGTAPTLLDCIQLLKARQRHDHWWFTNPIYNPAMTTTMSTSNVSLSVVRDDDDPDSGVPAVVS